MSNLKKLIQLFISLAIIFRNIFLVIFQSVITIFIYPKYRFFRWYQYSSKYFHGPQTCYINIINNQIKINRININAKLTLVSYSWLCLFAVQLKIVYLITDSFQKNDILDIANWLVYNKNYSATFLKWIWSLLLKWVFKIWKYICLKCLKR